MKKLLFLPTLIIVLSIFSVLGTPVQNLNSAESENILKRSLPDSLYTKLKNRPIIFYSSGHYGYSWSLIARIDSTYQIYCGRVSYTGDQNNNETSESIPFDTTKLIIHNNAILSWGFDSISVEATNMEKVYRSNYITLCTDLYVFNSNGVNIFNSGDAISFAGRDSIGFNEKFQKLCLIMMWLSDSRIRKYIPDSAIY
ncbi:MAG: hypothetical protein K2O00_03900 [Muribaculaceae bacterium]|nr:hypothetical protein [Muribaculaceae bacterium]